MRRIVYQCDRCRREYEYELKVEDAERGILARIPELGIEICRKCLKELKTKL